MKRESPMTAAHSVPSFVVLLATYNGADWLREQLESILGQQDVAVHVFISDDLSTDDTLPLLQSLADERITLLPSVGKFGSAAQNFFRLLRDVDVYCYDYVAFSDQDDIWEPDKLWYSVKTMRSRSADAFSSNVTAFWDNGDTRLVVKSQMQVEWDHLFQSGGPGCTYVLNRRLAMETKEFLYTRREDSRNVALHDWFFYAFARSRGYRWWIDSRPTVRYRQHGHNEFGVNIGMRAALARWNTLLNGWYRNQVLLLASLCGAADAWPIRRLQRYHPVDRMILAANVVGFRRNWKDCITLALAFLLSPSSNRQHADRIGDI